MVTKLNDYVLSEDKPAKDKELADWFHICGTAYRMVMPDTPEDEDEAPFEIYTLDPRFCFVVYSVQLGNPPLMAPSMSRWKMGQSFSAVTRKTTSTR